MLVCASVTDSLVTFATHVIRDLGLPGVFLLVAADALGIPIAAGVILLFAGFNTTAAGGHHDTIVGVIIAGFLGDLAGSCVAYAIGYTGGHELLERHGRKLHVTPGKLRLAHGWFERWGAPVLFFGRHIPFVRTYVSYPAGAVRMSFRRFVLWTGLGSVTLAIAWALIGKAVGHRWTDWKDKLGYVDYAVVAILLIVIAWLAVRWWRNRGRPADVPA